MSDAPDTTFSNGESKLLISIIKNLTGNLEVCFSFYARLFFLHFDSITRCLDLFLRPMRLLCCDFRSLLFLRFSFSMLTDAALTHFHHIPLFDYTPSSHRIHIFLTSFLSSSFPFFHHALCFQNTANLLPQHSPTGTS